MNDMGAKITQVDQTADYRTAFMAERIRLTREDTRPLEILALPVGIAADDQGPLMHDQFVTLRQHRMEIRKLKLVDAALLRLDRGEFGLCADCDESIPTKRLKVMPWAAYCVPCQDRTDSLGDADTSNDF
jgi:RNA polymerase-binding transcription factor DksA